MALLEVLAAELAVNTGVVLTVSKPKSNLGCRLYFEPNVSYALKQYKEDLSQVVR